MITFVMDVLPVERGSPVTRIEKHQELLPLRERVEGNKSRNIGTGDESWFTLEYQHSAKWRVAPQEVSEGVRQQINTKGDTDCCLGRR
jgi:hypothetical protein